MRRVRRDRAERELTPGELGITTGCVCPKWYVTWRHRTRFPGGDGGDVKTAQDNDQHKSKNTSGT